jgi:uncharacterized protein (TIGR02246 family)
MKTKVCILAAGGVLAAFLMTPGRWTGERRSAAQDKAGSGEATATKRVDDEKAVRQAMADFLKLVEKGDAKAVAASFTENGEYIEEDGATLRGRAAIAAAYAKEFAKKKNRKVDVTIESVRFPSQETAIEEGYAKSYQDGFDQPTVSRYSVLHVREGGHWLMAVLREWPDEGIALRDLDWLIGTWEAKAEDADVRTTYEWDARKNSIRSLITIKEKGRIVSGTQVLLKDPRTGQLRSWLFFDDGGFGDSTWAPDGKRWTITATGIRPDGGEMTATNILTPVDKDKFLWQSTNRTLDGEELPNIPPLKVTRVK